MCPSIIDPGDICTLKYIITHVFFPLQLPDEDDHSIPNDQSLAKAIVTAARLYSDHVGQANISQWHSISKMLGNLQAMTQSENMDMLQAISQFGSMNVGDVLALRIRAQNAGVLFRKQKDVTIFESFELSPNAEDVMTTEGRLICSYPGPAMEISNLVYDDDNFRSELVNFLVHMNHDDLRAVGETSQKERSTDTVHPRYITELLTGILRGIGRPADIVRISKRVGDDVVCKNSLKSPWRRSSFWLLIRVALQTTLDRSPLGHATYKEFLLFFICLLAKEKNCADLPSDLLHFMLAKISRRLRKLGTSAPDWLSCTVLQTCTSLRSIIENRWRDVQAAQQVSPLWTPSQLDLTRDIQLSLLHSRDYLCNTLASNGTDSPDVPFNPKHHIRGALDDFLSLRKSFFEAAYRNEPRVALYDVERAVEQDINAWVSRVTNNDEACMKLEILADGYFTRAFETYANNPELLSVMLLTTIELWVALDKIAIKEIPILADYSPEIPMSLLEDLLLCKTASLHRLCNAYQYLSRRHARSRSQWSVFSSTTTLDSFAIRFYRKSLHLRRLKNRIEEAARREVRERIAEMREKNAHYSEIRKQYGRTADMKMRVHEWPLPANQLEAELVVFELDCPVSFNMWRMVTFRLLVDLFHFPSTRRDIPTKLNQYPALKPYLVVHARSRISLGSYTKPFIDLHPTTPIPAKQGQVCVNNEMSFFAFDTHTGTAVSQVLGRSNRMKGYCTYKLPSGPYYNLQKYVDSTSHTSNQVVARQGDCHRDLIIHEYMAFGHLRSGSLLQWFNILRELRSRSLSFRRYEVHMLLAQAVSQVGPFSNTEWMWHQEIQQPAFCYALIGELESLVRGVEASWLEGVTMDTISLLLRRLLASNPDQAVSLEALGLLRSVRGKVFSWVQELSARLIKTPGDEGFRGVLRDTAAICRSTFDVDPAMIPMLLRSAEDIEILLSSAILIHEHMPNEVSRLPTYSQLLLDRDYRLSLALENVVSDIVRGDPRDQGINLAVGRIWPGYCPGSKWTSLQVPNSRWFLCKTAPPADQRPQVVHFNILDGSLLVNGRPLGTWLPNEFVRHPLYKLIFGGNMLEVLPGDLGGMDYTTRNLISDHQVYFSLRNNGSDLVIRAKRKLTVTGDSEITELIPRKTLEGDLPAVLIKGHAHWLNLSTSVMEIRPLERLWEASSENWKINCIPGKYHMQKGHESFIDIRSQSWNMVSSLLRPFSPPQDLIVSVSPVDSSQPTSSLQLSVLLPCYDLSFYVDEDGDLQSCNLQGMVYDENQSIGTLFGLVNRLVLRPKIGGTNSAELVPRCILIPDGVVSFEMDGYHVRVMITTNRPVSKRVLYQAYKVDTDLGYLTGNGSLTNKLYCAYLHALTSGCSADPLTGRSGTEEALSILQSASFWSNLRFDPRDVELLSLIASIYPPRTWRPKQSMETVRWHNLPICSQNYRLFVLSKAIKEHYEKVQAFYDSHSSTLFQDFPLQNDHLLKRNMRRAAYLLPPDFSAQLSETNVDVRYSARDQMKVTSGEHCAYTAATYVHRRTATSKKKIWEIVKSWAQDMPMDNAVSLQYDRSWLAPDLPLIWLKTYNLLRENDERKWFRLLFSLPSMSYASSNLSKLVPVFVSFASHSQFRLEDPPHYDSYRISDGYCPSRSALHRYLVGYAYSPDRSGRAKYGPSFGKAKQHQLGVQTNATIKRLLDAWPCEESPPFSLNPELYYVVDVESKVQDLFSSCFRNLKLKEHLTRVQMILNNLHSAASPTPNHDALTYSFNPSQNIPSRIPWPLMVHQLLARPAPAPTHEALPRYTADVGNTISSISESAPLHQLITKVGVNAVNPFQCRYVSALRTSAESFASEMSQTVTTKVTKLPVTEALLEYYNKCRASYMEALHHLQRHLGPKSQSEEAVEQSGEWPRITAQILLRCLASNSPIALSDDWKRCLIWFALLALELQRARRLLLLHLENLHEELWNELQNEGCDGWNAELYPDWLLIQLQGNFLIRRVQAEVANEMISPRSGDNTAMQLNMGEGKSSVIVPIATVVLANGDQLVRVIVPKSLTAQTLYLLADRLGGFTNRRIYYLPFSRSFELNHRNVCSLRQVMWECMLERGVLVLQPEHVQALKLVSVEKQLSQGEDHLVAHPLLELQKWLHSHSRDILDESDEILDVRSELVFTIGHQQHIEGFPERWTTTEQVLSLVSQHASSLRELFPLGVEYEPGPPGSFPYLRILQADAGEKLISWLADDVMKGLLPNISFRHLHLHSSLRDAIRSFISSEDVLPEKARLVKEYFGLMWSGLLLLRGLLANGILLFAFSERRWRVDYGLSPARTTLAVPYRAKDVPAEKAEFGHPDIGIILTCLSYYYAGLGEEQLKLSFGILFKQHDPSLDYDLWIQAFPSTSVPESLQILSGINVESVEQWKSLFPLFSRNRATIDFYLSNVVFPREAKEFPSKLSSSGWDLAEKKERPLTGFSGTNDGQYLLPLHIAQRDPDHQRGTNAKVLSCLLQPENNHYMCIKHKDGKRRTTHEFLEILVEQKPEIRVLLDVGAQMLDLQNYELAKAWLDISSNASAAIYVNEDDELMVCTRDGRTQLLRSSLYGQQLDRCVVYLDDAHTRGTDIKFPADFRAAVTLGPKVTKDRLAQGCMRMRKLGHGHSIMFFAPLEVDQHIRSVAAKDKDPLAVIDTMDILYWAIRETWENIQRWAPHWVQQGIDHASRYGAWTGFRSGQLISQELSDIWLQPEAKKLEELYAPRNPLNSALLTSQDIRQRCIDLDLGALSLSSVGMDEEQERELVYEVKHERQVERPLSVLPADHSVHRDVIDFIKTGVIPTGTKFFRARTKAFSPAFETLGATSAATDEAYIWSRSVLATIDFEETVKESGKIDDYLRPVQWIISAKRTSNDLLVILSPFEVNCLLPDIRSSNKVHLHLYTPRIIKSMKPCDDLALYSIPRVPNGWIAPPSFMDELNVFAGQLYLKDYKTYIRLCRFLCVYARDLQGEDGIHVEHDGFILPRNRAKLSQAKVAHTFSNTPIVALKALMDLRSKGLDFASTHMGKLLRGQLLSENDFDG